MSIDIPSLVSAAPGGELVGKVRLQETVHLLDQLGLNSGFSYEYHHYGPYSEELAEQVVDDVVIGRLEADPRRRQSDGVPYVAYRVEPADDGSQTIIVPLEERMCRALAEMQRRSATVLELAATMHWLAVTEGRADWQSELKRRKGAKADNGRDGQALELLRTRIDHAVGSSSFDADRLDYLVRDRYMTGTGAGAIDLEWLMDNNRVAEIDFSAHDSDGEDATYEHGFCPGGDDARPPR